MQPQDSQRFEPEVPLFDVVIGMLPDADLQTIQRLAIMQAGLPPDRVERLIQVLRSSPNAKVGSAVTLERANEELTRFTKAGLLVDIVPVLNTPADFVGSQQSQINDNALKAHASPPPRGVIDFQQSIGLASSGESSRESLEAAGLSQTTSEPEPKHAANKTSAFGGNAALVLACAVAFGMALLYAGEKGVTVGGVALPWGKGKQLASAAGNPTLDQIAPKAADGAAPDQSGDADADADDPLIQAAKGASAKATGTADPTDGMTKPARQLLTADFANVLAELGQGTRAKEVLKSLSSSINPAVDVQAAAALQAAQLKLLAWSIQRMELAQAGQTIDMVKTRTKAITNAQDRALLQAQAAAIFSRSAALTSDAPRAFLLLAAESAKAISGPQASTMAGHVAVLAGEAALNQTTRYAKTGMWSKAKAKASQIEELVAKAPDAWTQARLHALDHAAKLQTGQVDKAAKSLESALALVSKSSNLPERAAWLRGIGQLSDATTQEPFDAVASSLQSQLNTKTGMEKAQGFAELYLLYTAAGLPGRAAQLRNAAQSTAGLNAADSASINADITIRGDLAMAKTLHAQARYAEAEALLQRIAGYLF